MGDSTRLTRLELEIFDTDDRVRMMLEAMAMGRWPMLAKIHGHLSSMLHRCDLKLRADRFAGDSS